MLAVGIWLATLGYAVFYYGTRVWLGVDTSIARTLGWGH